MYRKEKKRRDRDSESKYVKSDPGNGSEGVTSLIWRKHYQNKRQVLTISVSDQDYIFFFVLLLLYLLSNGLA